MFLLRYTFVPNGSTVKTSFQLQTAYGDGNCCYRAAAYALNGLGIEVVSYDHSFHTTTNNPCYVEQARILLQDAVDVLKDEDRGVEQDQTDDQDFETATMQMFATLQRTSTDFQRRQQVWLWLIVHCTVFELLCFF